MKKVYQVERAIIMAAGRGTRLKPVTDDIPKALVKVNGQRMIDTIIDALLENDIKEIYVVVGYLKEKFNVLKEKYPNIKFIYNSNYDKCNNISSLYVAREHIHNAIILDGDQIIYNKNVLKKEFTKSGYNAVWSKGKTNEWLLKVQDGTIINCSRNGGSNGWQLYSISRWNELDGQKLKRDIEIEYQEKLNTNIYWDDVPMFCHRKDFKLGIFEMQKEDVKEIDTFDELLEIDKTYGEIYYEKV